MSQPKRTEKYILQSLDQVISTRFGRYSKYIIQDRALPDVRDGLKPVQRRILFSMFELGLMSNKPFKKSARVVGDVIGKYHPHGDSSIYEALVRMSQTWKMNVQLVTMHGNNGSVDDDPAAAMRYTETRLAKISEHLLDGIKQATVKFAPNFDDSEREPTVLPALFPNLLVNGAKGIASGYATEMPPHNLSEIITAIIFRLKSPNCRLESLVQIVKGPDFPTGGLIEGTSGIYEALERGRGKIQIKARFTVVKQRQKNIVTISEIPFGVNKAKLIRHIDEIRYHKTIDGLLEIRDESDREGIAIVIELDAALDATNIMNYLLAKTELAIYYSYNNVVIQNRAPRVLGLIGLIDAYLAHQIEVHRNLVLFMQKRDQARHEIVLGLKRVSAIATEVIEVIRNAEGSRQGVIAALVATFNFTARQAEAIALLKLYRLSKVDQTSYTQETAELATKLTWYALLLANQDEMKKWIISKLRALQKEFGTARKTIISVASSSSNIKMDQLIKHEAIWIGLSCAGYLKRFTNRAYEANEITKYGLKELDSLFLMQHVNTASKLLIFTNYGHYIALPIHQIKEVKYQDVGAHLNTFVSLQPTEEVVGAVVVENFAVPAYIIFVTKQAKAKRTQLADFNVSRFRKALQAINLAEDDRLVGVSVSNGSQKIVIISANGNAVKYNEDQINIYAPRSKGVKAMVLLDQNYVTSFALVSATGTLGLVSNRGGLKKIKVANISELSRRTAGRPLYKTFKKHHQITADAVALLKQDETVLLRTKDEQNMILHFQDIENSKAESGFSKAPHFQLTNAKIMMPWIINATTMQKRAANVETAFTKAEETIAAVRQISIEDILKKL